MDFKLKRICTICARGGSKGVPGKNIRPLLGKPLIAWTVEQALATRLFSHIAVSSDDPLILAAAKTAGADILIERPAELATDASSKLPAIVHALRTAESRLSTTFDILVDLDATSPLRSVEDIAGAVAMLEREGCTNVITGSKARRSPYFNLVERDATGRVSLSKGSQGGVVRRQDAPDAFDMNASIYVWNRDKFLADPSVIYDDTGLFEMPEERSHDIDSEMDFKIVELMIREKYPPEFRQAYELSGRVAVVTGACGILGKRFCAILAEHGANIAVVDRAGAGSDAVAALLKERFGVIAKGYDLDVTDPVAVAQTVKDIEESLGPVAILHNNAASKGPDLARFFDNPQDYRPEIWRAVMNVNVDGYFYIAREVGTRMAERGRGSIIQTASIYGIMGPDQRIYEGSEYLGMPINTPAVYSTSKAAVVGLTRHLAAYWGAQGVRVNTLTPGGVESGQNEEFSRRYSARVPLGRMANADDMAHGLLFLASDASAYVTGHNLVIDGGLSTW